MKGLVGIFVTLQCLIFVPQVIRAEDFPIQVTLIVEKSSVYEAEVLVREGEETPLLLWSDFEEVCGARVQERVFSELRRQIPKESTSDGKEWAAIGRLRSPQEG